MRQCIQVMKQESNNIKMRTIVLTTLILLCNFGITKAQNRGDHLEPLKSMYDYSDSSIEYRMKVRKILFSGLSDRPEIRFLEIPSFTPESVLDIEFNQDKCYLIYHICEENIWYNRSKEQIKVHKFRTEINKASFVLIKKLFDLAIAGVRFPTTPVPEIDEDGRVVLLIHNLVEDGTSYYITTSVWGQYKKTGTIHSPGKGTKIGRLVNIGYQLIELAKSEKQIVDIGEKLQDEIETLIEELK